MSRENGTLCSFNLENNTTFAGIKAFDPAAYVTSLWDECVPESSCYSISTFAVVSDGDDDEVMVEYEIS